MDFQSRELYRHTVAHYAEHSDCSEQEIAKLAMDLARESQSTTGERDPRVTWRKSHVGYYLVGEGADVLRRARGRTASLGRTVAGISCDGIRRSSIWAGLSC